jgi:uncharacterized phiE125 gp8 family phage protein
MMLSLYAAPTVEPIELDDAYTQLRLTTTESETASEVSRKISSARRQVERFTRRALVSQTWDLYLDGFPCGAIELPRPPLISVTAVTYRNTAGSWITLAPASYVVSAPVGPTAERGTISLAYSQTWPSTYGEVDVVKVRFVAGYGTTAVSVPDDLRDALLLILGDLYEHRTGGGHDRTAAEAIMSSYRSVRW